MGLSQSRPADLQFEQCQDGRRYRLQLWQTEGAPFSRDRPQPLRVVRAESRTFPMVLILCLASVLYSAFAMLCS